MFLKNKNIIFKIRRSKVTDYAALRVTRILLVQDSSVHVSSVSPDCSKTSVGYLTPNVIIKRLIINYQSDIAIQEL